MHSTLRRLMPPLLTCLALAAPVRSQSSFDWLYTCDRSTDTIQRWDPVSATSEVVLSGLSTPIDLVVDEEHCRLFWISDGDNAIRQAALDGTDVVTIVTSPEPRGLALDGKNHHLYYMDRALDVIRRHDLKTGTTITIRQMGLIPDCYIPLSIALDVDGGSIYWTDPCQQTVNRVGLDGGNAQVLHVNQTDVRGLALDLVNGHLYWVTAAAIRRSGLDGTGTVPLVDLTALGAVNPNLIALDVPDDTLYWTQLGSVQSADLSGAGVTAAVPTPAPSGLSLVTETEESFDFLYFADSNGSLGRWEAPAGGTGVVAAGLSTPLDVVVDVDRCSLYWISDGTNEVKASHIDGTGVVTLASSPEPRGLALDTELGWLFFLDRTIDRIRRIDLEDPGAGVTDVASASGIPLTIRLDTEAQHIYWCDVSSGTINRIDYGGAPVMPTPVVSGEAGKDLRGFDLDLEAGKVFWVNSSEIQCQDIAGGPKQQLVTLPAFGSSGPNLIALDRCKEKMYWTELGHIVRADLDGSDVELVLSTPKPSGLVLQDCPIQIPWRDLGGATVGSAGVPELAGFGSLAGGTPASVKLIDVPPGALILGWVSLAPAPFTALGGTVHAFPFVNQFLFAVPGSGEFAAPVTWPAGLPVCTQLWIQFLIDDPGTLHGITLSNGLRATTP